MSKCKNCEKTGAINGLCVTCRVNRIDELEARRPDTELAVALENLIEAEEMDFNGCCSECDNEMFEILAKRLELAKQVLAKYKEV
jgi:chorismate mutase